MSRAYVIIWYGAGLLKIDRSGILLLKTTIKNRRSLKTNEGFLMLDFEVQSQLNEMNRTMKVDDAYCIHVGLNCRGATLT